MTRTAPALIALVFWLAGSAASPASETGRLDKIRVSGRIMLGFPDAAPPFAFLDGQGKPIGYTLEICESVAQKLKAELGLPKLDVRYNPLVLATRIPLITTLGLLVQ